MEVQNPLARFARYTSGKEPVVTVNVIAALILAVIVKASQEWLGVEWDELMLTIAGITALSAATYLARRGVFSPFTHDVEVKAALDEEPPA